MVDCFRETHQRLLSLQESPSKHPILRTPEDVFCRTLESYIASDFAKVKREIGEQFPRERALDYVEKYSYLYEYVQTRYPSTDYEVSPESKMNDVRQLVYKIAFHQMMEVNDDYFYILFDYYPALQAWASEFAWKFSEPVTLMIVYNKTKTEPF